jgi:hypothetical protein
MISTGNTNASQTGLNISFVFGDYCTVRVNNLMASALTNTSFYVGIQYS